MQYETQHEHRLIMIVNTYYKTYDRQPVTLNIPIKIIKRGWIHKNLRFGAAWMFF